MKAVLVGLGNFGSYWYRQLRLRGLEVCVVEANIQLKESIDPGVAFYSSLEDAIAEQRPDIVVNVTPPHVHAVINEIAFAHGLPVLCEKPISNDLAEAKDIVEKSELLGVPLMISANYRYHAPARKAKELLDGGVIGSLSSIHIEFYRYHEVAVPYFLKLEHPLLQDVAIHHFDLLRYFTGLNANRVSAHSSNPPGSWCDSNIHLNAWFELEQGVIANYQGSMMAKDKLTEWYGDWRFEGAEGVLLLGAENVRLIREGKPEEVYPFSGMGEMTSLDEFLAALKGNRQPSPNAREYLKSQTLVYAAVQSTNTGQPVWLNEI
jgi:predicted dehydrogenase